jgi:hypothetical protein
MPTKLGTHALLRESNAVYGSPSAIVNRAAALPTGKTLRGLV